MGQGIRVRIYCDEGDRGGHTSLRQAVVHLLWKECASGVTVISGDEGFGSSRHMHSIRLVDLAANRPLLIEWMDTADKFEAIWPKLAPLVAQVVVTKETVEVLVLPHHKLRSLSSDSTVADVMRTPVVTVAPTASLQQVVEVMEASDRRFLPVTDGQRVVGVITNGDLVERGGSVRLELRQVLSGRDPVVFADKTAGDVMQREVVSTTPDAHLPQVAQVMIARKSSVSLLSMTTASSSESSVGSTCCVRSRMSTPTRRRLSLLITGRTIGDIAVFDVPTVTPSTSVADVLDAVVSTRLNRAVVIDDERRVLGIISDAELLRRVGGQHQSIVDRLMRRGEGRVQVQEKTARELMVSPVVTVPRSMSVPEAIRQMLVHRWKLLPVVDDQGRLCGMVDRADALLATFSGPEVGDL